MVLGLVGDYSRKTPYRSGLRYLSWGLVAVMFAFAAHDKYTGRSIKRDTQDALRIVEETRNKEDRLLVSTNGRFREFKDSLVIPQYIDGVRLFLNYNTIDKKIDSCSQVSEHRIETPVRLIRQGTRLPSYDFYPPLVTGDEWILRWEIAVIEKEARLAVRNAKSNGSKEVFLEVDLNSTPKESRAHHGNTEVTIENTLIIRSCSSRSVEEH